MKDFNSIIIRYGEIALKGKNRGMFERKLIKHIKGLLEKNNINDSQVILKRGRIYIENIQKMVPLEIIFGIHSYSPALKITKDYEVLKTKIAELTKAVREAVNFRVSCQRIDKSFFKTSVEIEREIGEILFESTKIPVSLKNPDLNVQIEVGEEGIYIFFEKFKGPRGLPYGTAGKLVSLISSGIDSPVATYMLMKRGVEPILLHIGIGDYEYQKVINIKKRLEVFSAGHPIKMILILREELFKGNFDKLYNNSQFNPYICLFCKHLMYRKANEVAKEEQALGIITGDNLAQVASQTLKNLYAYKQGFKYPVYSPLIAFEKEDIVKIAREIGTYDLSIKVSKDGCIPPKRPKTAVSLDQFLKVLKESGL